MQKNKTNTALKAGLWITLIGLLILPGCQTAPKAPAHLVQGDYATVQVYLKKRVEHEMQPSNRKNRMGQQRGVEVPDKPIRMVVEFVTLIFP